MIAAGLLFLRRLGQINWGLADQAVVSAGNFLTTLLLARALGVEEFGRFTLAWMVVLFTSHIQQALIMAPMMSIGPKQEDPAPAYFGAVLVQQAAFTASTGVCLLVGLAVADSFLAGDLTALGPALVAASFAHQGHEFLRHYFFTGGRGPIALLADSVRYLGQGAAIALCLRSPALNGPYVLWLITAAALASGAVGICFLGPLTWDPAVFRRTLSRNWRFSRWLVAAYATGWIGGNIYLFAAGHLLGPAAVGMIKAAQALLGVTQLAYFGMFAAAPAEAARAFVAGGMPRLVAYLRRIACLGLALACSVTLVVVVAPQLWLDLLFGPGYASTRPLIIGLGVLQMMMFIELPASLTLRTMERTSPIWWATLCSALVALAISYPTVALLGLHGVVVGGASSAALKLVIVWRQYRATLDRAHPAALGDHAR